MAVRKDQMGGVGIAVMLAALGGAVVLYIGYSFVNKFIVGDLDEAPAPAASAVVEEESAGPQTQSLVSFDNNFFRSGDTFYVRIEGGGAGGKDTYIAVEIADAKTFRKVPVLGGDQREEGKKSGRMPGFYMDSKQVYFFTGQSVQVVPGADPNSFQVLSPTYAKDADNVYVVSTTCDGSGNCSGTITIIPAADPETFQTFYNTEVPDPDGPGEVTIDASDENNIYYQGIWVGPLPDPDDHTVHPDVDNPVLISP